MDIFYWSLIGFSIGNTTTFIGKQNRWKSLFTIVSPPPPISARISVFHKGSPLGGGGGAKTNVMLFRKKYAF